ncbi:MAG: arsenate reductase ArsC [Caldimicrobium sp.]|nr:arsenate reductase ArsC [Caldimicrobium sp.]MCX7612984.1 arsenate reductase ArsC [Caldimicrobium sp.]MDW8183223.1 arsenate reductase ArsC [Caldimicrobium sp.]
MKIAFICTGNTARSQMAEAYGKYFANLYKKEIEVYSAGALPEKEVNPLVVEVMQEEGFDLSSARPKGLEEIPVESLDLVVTLCDSARQSCPYLPTARLIHWSFPDPAKLEGSKEEILQRLREIREEIKRSVETLIKQL